MKKKIIILLLVIVIATFGVGIIFYAFANPFLKITLIGEDVLTLEVGSTYQEEGVKVEGTKENYQVAGNIDSNKVGNYELEYSIQNMMTKKKVKRSIQVVDTTTPVIELKESDVTIYEKEEYHEPGYQALDNYDGDIINKVMVNTTLDNQKEGEYTITYEVEDSSKNKSSVTRIVMVKKRPVVQKPSNNVQLPYVKGILLVNKKYHLPSNYNPGVDRAAYQALEKMQNDARGLGYNLTMVSGFRSYWTQQAIYNRNVQMDGEELANTYSAKPGESEHQSGLAFDVGAIDDNFGETPQGKWLHENCHKYGFILRYLKGKENITGYKYEPWHIRYVGVEVATKIYEKGITLEEYLGVN